MRSRLGVPGAILTTSLVWSAIHLQYDFYGCTTIFASGLVPGYARYHSQSIIPPIIMHALMNLVAILQVVFQISPIGPGK